MASPARKPLVERGWILPGIVIAFLAITIPCLKDFGPGWDITILYFGERYLDFYASGFDASYLDFDTPLDDAPLFAWAEEGPELAWPVGLVAAAITRRVFQGSLGWLDPVEAYNLCALLWVALTLVSIGIWAKKTLGAKTAWISLVLIAGYPSLLGMALQNPKDLPSVGLFTASLTAGALALESRSRKTSIVFVVLLGLALGAKTNAIFVPPILLAWVGLTSFWPGLRFGNPLPFLAKVGVSAAIVCPLIVFLVWPWLWFDTWEHLQSHWMRVAQNRFGGASLGAAFLDALWVTPLPVLLGFALGLWALFRNRDPRARRALWLALIWLCVPLLRASLPGVKLYDGVRRFLEFAPPLCIIAAAGFHHVIHRLPKGLEAAMVGILLIGSLWPAFTTHPFQIAYHNALVGGVRGAKAKGMDGATDYWAASYRGAFEWLAKNAEDDALIIASVAPHVAEMNRRVYGRPEMKVIGPPPPIRSDEIPDGTFYLLYVTKPAYYDAIARYAETLPAIYERCLDQVPMVRLHRIERDSPEHRSLGDVAAFGELQSRQALQSLAPRVEVDDPDPKIVGAYIGKLYELEGLDAARTALRKIMDRLRDPEVLRELEYFDHQLVESQRFWHRKR